MQQQERSNNSFGGVFAPLAQYPGASYAVMLRAKSLQGLPIPTSVPTARKTILRSNPNDGPHAMTVSATAPLFTYALLLVDTESNAVIDRRALRDVGIAQVKVLTSGVQAAKLLAAQCQGEEDGVVDVVFCHPRLSDMSGAQWTEMVRSHPRLTGLPILALAGNNNEAAQLKTMAAGFSGLLVRPYSHHSLRKNLQDLQTEREQDQLAQGNKQLDYTAFDAALRHFTLCLDSSGKADAQFQMGLRCLQERRWDVAIQAFHKALLQLSLKGEAELGLAAAWRGKGDLNKYRHYLGEAGQTFARASQWSKARMTYARLLLVAPESPSPFLQTAESHIRAGRYEEAAEALAAGYDMNTPETASQRLATACLFTENPAFSLDKVQRAMGATPLKNKAADLGQEIQKSMEAHEVAAEEKRAEIAERARQRAQYELTVPKVKTADTDHKRQDKEKNRSASGIALAPISDEIPGSPSLLVDEEQKNAQVLQPMRPLSEDDAQSRLFSSFPGLNEAMTVIKVTFKLMKK